MHACTQLQALISPSNYHPPPQAMGKNAPPQSWRRNEVTCYELKLFMLLENIQREEIDPKGLSKIVKKHFGPTQDFLRENQHLL
jgi:hypothetical protein